MVTVTDSPLLSNCNTFVINIAGTSTLSADLATLKAAWSWTDQNVIDLAAYTDGYLLTAVQTIAATPLAAAGFYGMCFAVDNAAKDAITGAFCVAYESAATETGNAAQNSRTTRYLTTAEWDGNYTSTAGTALTNVLNGLVFDPSVSAGADATGNAAGATISSSWYQPTSADTYTSLIRVQANDTVKSYSINGVSGTAVGSCSAASYTLTGSLALAMTYAATTATVLAIAY